MSTGGVFQIITNDGKQDRLLMASALLHRRLRDIEKIRSANIAIKDPTPTLVDIERTHILFMNSHFKPFVSMGYEYNVTKPNSGNVAFGESFQFDIPQFGDFFHDMVFHIILGELVPVNDDQYMPNPAPPPGPVPLVQDQVRWCDRLGHRLLKKVAFTVNGNPLDDYDASVANFYYEFYVGTDKSGGYERNIGQETANQGYLTNNPGSQNFREGKQIFNGPQTLKNVQGEVELWVPLLFWFNQDPALSIPSVAVPYGQRFIDVTLERIENLAECVTYAPGRSPVFVTPEIKKFELWINNIFISPEIHDIFIKRIGFSLVRVYRHQKFRLIIKDDDVLLNELKWPIETIYLGVVPNENKESLQNWYKFHKVIKNTYTTPVAYPNPIPMGPNIVGFVETEWEECEAIFKTISVHSHGIPLYPELPATFYNSYIPWKYGKFNIETPDDCGAYMITFNLYPGTYQPSGHINISRSREFHISYTSDLINKNYGVELQMCGIALNFLLISDGSLVMRYST